MEIAAELSAFTLEADTNVAALRTPAGRVVFKYVTGKPENTCLTTNSACFLHPVNTPSGERVTDLAPGDHRHHRGIFLAWHAMEFREPANASSFGSTVAARGWSIQRADFWGWGQFAPTTGRVIRNQHLRLVKSTHNGADLEIRNEWLIEDQIYLTETTAVGVLELEDVYILDFKFLLVPRQSLTLDRTAFSGFCVRARNDGTACYTTRSGPVTLADPHYSIPELNWPAADWYDYTIQLANSNTIGVAVIDHPANPPTTWHNPRYLSMLNPCLLANGPVSLAPEQPLQLLYRVVAHDGATPTRLLNRLSDEWKK